MQEYDIWFEDYLETNYRNSNTKTKESLDIAYKSRFEQAQGDNSDEIDFLLKISPLLSKGCKLIDISILTSTPSKQVEDILDKYPDCILKVLSQGN